MARHYWIIVASRDHVQRGVAGGFAQANHGKRSPLKRVKRGDGVIYYSSKAVYGEPEPLQAFTAIGSFSDDDIYAGEMRAGFTPARRNVGFLPSREAPIRPLIDQLEFIKDKTKWGAPFRYGMLEISQSDFDLIAAAMGAEGA